MSVGNACWGPQTEINWFNLLTYWRHMYFKFVYYSITPVNTSSCLHSSLRKNLCSKRSMQQRACVVFDTPVTPARLGSLAVRPGPSLKEPCQYTDHMIYDHIICISSIFEFANTAYCRHNCIRDDTAAWSWPHGVWDWPVQWSVTPVLCSLVQLLAKAWCSVSQVPGSQACALM